MINLALPCLAFILAHATPSRKGERRHPFPTLPNNNFDVRMFACLACKEIRKHFILTAIDFIELYFFESHLIQEEGYQIYS